jgi:tetraether lipid synthase
VQHDLDRLGIAKTAREEKIRARDAKIKETAENERMAKLYREHILKEQPTPGIVQISGIAPAPKPAPAPVPVVEEREEVGSFGD